MRGPKLKLSYLIIATLITVGALPLFLYGRRVIGLSHDALRTKELEYQTASTRALADEIGLFHSASTDALQDLGQGVVVLGNGRLDGNRLHAPEIRGLLAQAVTDSSNVLYASIVNLDTQGVSAGRIGDPDVFLRRAIERAYLVSRAGQSVYTPVTISLAGRPQSAILHSIPLRFGDQVVGVALEVDDFSPLQRRLDDMANSGLECFIVGRNGRLITQGHASGQHRDLYTPGEDLSHLEIIQRWLSWHGTPLASETTSYVRRSHGVAEDMLGTYSSVPALPWAVIAQRPKALAFVAADQLTREGYFLMLVSLAISIIVGVYLSGRLTSPLQVLHDRAQALARRELSGRIEINDHTEIGDLARSFNTMAEAVEHYVAELKHAAEQNHELFLGSIHVLAQAVDEKDPYTRGHSDRVTRYSVAIARRLGLPIADVERVRIGAQLHDVGKIGIDDRILKKPGALSADEFEIMKQHTVKGANIVRKVERLHDVLPGIELHHERVDGKGYPYGLRGEQIPLIAKIIAVADAFDAMTTERPYQAAFKPDAALAIIREGIGARYDREVVEAFDRALSEGDLRARPLSFQLSAR